MQVILRFIYDYFRLGAFILFLLSSMFLLVYDSKEYKKRGLTKEYKFSKFMGYFYIAAGTALFIIAKYRDI